MTFRHFLIWLGERLIEWQLAIALLLAVKFLLPVSPESYVDFSSFVAGTNQTLSNNLADAAFMMQNFMDGDWRVYWANAWRGAGWLIGLHVYLQALYIFASLLSRRIAPEHPLRGGLVAWLASFAILCGLYRENHDPGSLRLALCLLVGGSLVVTLSAALGSLFTTPARSVSRRTYSPLPRGPVFDNEAAKEWPETQPEKQPEKQPVPLPAVAAPQPSAFRRERLYFSE